MTDTAPYQGMSAGVMAELLALIQSFDRTFVPDDVDVRTFVGVARDYRWTQHEAATVIRKWGADHPEGQRMDASLLNRLIREHRQDQLLRRPVATAYGPAVAEETLRQRLMAVWQQEKRRSKGLSQARRALVLKHPDLAAQLCSSLIGYSKPENWNGWIPPELLAPDASGNAAKNDSHRRAALVRLVAEAQAREVDGE